MVETPLLDPEVISVALFRPTFKVSKARGYSEMELPRVSDVLEMLQHSRSFEQWS